MRDETCKTGRSRIETVLWKVHNYRTEATLSEWRLELTSCLHDSSARFGQLDYSQPPRSRILSVLNNPSTPQGIGEWRELTLLTGRVSLEI